MRESEITHDTFEITRAYLSSTADLFAAFSKPAIKQAWYADSPSHETLQYHLDFKRGGREVLEARMLPATPIAGAVLMWSSEYAEIQQDRRIVFFQSTDLDGRCISTAVITLEFFATSGGCDLKLTHQGVFFEGGDGPEMRKMGWNFLLDSLAAALPG